VTQDGPAEAAVAADEVPGWARGVSTVAVQTGAGVSTDSGIPDFRGSRWISTVGESPQMTSVRPAFWHGCSTELSSSPQVGDALPCP
jgi:hypothetical protein